MMSISLVAVFLAAVIAFIIGFLMHGPVAGKLWMRLAGVTPTGNEKFSDMYGKMFANLVVNVITAWALAAIIAFATDSLYLSGDLLQDALLISFIVWAGFIAASAYINVIWTGLSFKLWAFEAFSSLLAMLAMGVTIALL